VKGVFVRPLTGDDVQKLDKWRREFAAGDLELPKDFNSEGVLSVAAHKEHELIASLTGVQAVVLDPFIHNPDANPTDLLFALVKLDTVLTFWGQQRGAVDAYVAIPNSLDRYIKLLRNYGWEPTVQNCTVMRRPLKPDFIPLIGPGRDELERKAKEIAAALVASDNSPVSNTLE
jgi:hypothetical protein